jgi:hypothetical protein
VNLKVPLVYGNQTSTAFITKPKPDPESESKLFVFFPDTMVCTGCCSTLDHIVTYLFKQVTMKGKKNELINQADIKSYLIISHFPIYKSNYQTC